MEDLRDEISRLRNTSSQSNSKEITEYRLQIDRYQQEILILKKKLDDYESESYNGKW